MIALKLPISIFITLIYYNEQKHYYAGVDKFLVFP